MGRPLCSPFRWRSALSNRSTAATALGVLAGIVTIPIGRIGGDDRHAPSGVQINGQPVEFTFALILMNMIPVLIVAVLVCWG